MLALPAHIHPEHSAAVATLAASLAEEFGAAFLGMLIGGSVGQGTARVDSDIDIFILIDALWYQRRREDVGGVGLDIFINPPARVLYKLMHEESSSLIENYAQGWIAYDPSHQVLRISEAARARYARGRRAVTPIELFASRSSCENLVEMVVRAAAASDSLALNYAAAVLAARVVESYYILKAKWDPPPKHRMRELVIEDPEFCALLRVLLDSGSVEAARAGAATSIVEQIFGAEQREGGRKRWGPRRPFPRP